MESMEKVKTVTFNIVLVVLASVALFWGATIYRQHVQFDKGESAWKAGDFISAVAGYESAIHMYTPGSSLVEESAERLWALGQTFEQKGDVARALVAYRSLRSSFYAVAGLNAPGQEWIAKCDARIAELVKRQR